MRIASYNTLNKSRKTRIAYAYSAIEREWFESENVELAAKAMDELEDMSLSEMMDWALKEVEFRKLNA